jgi:transcriptional regulator with PAS, ATPase and Fis domain
MESELFGHEEGAFTGAQSQRKGKIEQAQGGTLFLDEVGSISPKMQVDLLRVLETREVTRIGGEQLVRVDFRVICATNADLNQALDEGRFRRDLYHRINVFAIKLPPLRDRPTDIPLLANHFLQQFASRTNKNMAGIEPDTMEILMTYKWPGNVRELSNAIEHAVVVGRNSSLRAEDLPLETRAEAAVSGGDSLAEIEKRHITAVLDRVSGNVTLAAKILQVDRVTVYNKIKKYGLER